MAAGEKYITASEQTAALENYAILADQMVGDGSEVVQTNGAYVPWYDECYLIAEPDAQELSIRDVVDYEPRWLLSSMPAIYLNDGKLFQLAPNNEPIDIHTFLTEGSLGIHDNDYYSQYEDDDYQRLKRYLEIGQLLIMTVGSSATTNHRKYFRILSLYIYDDIYEIRVCDGIHMYGDGHLSSGSAWMFHFDFSNSTVTYYFEEV